MKICFLSSMHPANDKRVHYKEAVSLIKAGFAVTHICPDPEGNRILDGVKVVTFGGKRSILGRLSRLKALYDLAVTENADAYHCNEVDSWMVGVALKILHKKYLIFDSHEIPSHDFAETRVPRLLRPLVIFCLRILFRLMLLFTDNIVLAKRSADLDFRKTRVPKTLVQNFSDPDVTTMAAANNNGSDITVIHLGAINKMRGWPQMLAALALTKNKNIKLRVIGQFGDNTQDEFLQSAKDRGLSERVIFEPWIPYNEVFAALKACDIGIILFQPVMLSFTHALPHKLFDYMLAELPVIVPDFALEVAEIVRSSDAGILVDPTDIDKVAQTLDLLAADPALRQRLGGKGRKAVLETYNWQTEQKKLVAMYEGIKSRLAA